MLKYIHQSEYGTAVYFAEIFYDNISNKKKLTANEKHFLYLYADCLVHCDNQYRAKQFFQEILTKEENTSFEKYEDFGILTWMNLLKIQKCINIL